MRRERLVFRREAPRVGIPGDGKLFDESPIHQIECLFSLFGLEDSRGGSRRHRPTARVASVVHCSSPLNGRRVSTVAKVELPYMALQSPQMDTRSSGGLEAESAPDPGERQTRLSGAWTALIVGIAALVVILVFVLQNLQNVRVNFLIFDGELPLAIALLSAMILGAIIVLAFGGGRILQLRMVARRARLRRVKASPPVA
jgi:putative membrane protein